MRIGVMFLAGLSFCSTCLPGLIRAQTPANVPHLAKQGNATNWWWTESHS